jgi:hypothetical protein
MSLTFVVNTLTAWDEAPRARHQLAFALAKKHKVIFIERNKTGRKKIDIREIQENLSLITPYHPVDYRYRYRLPLFNEHYQKWLFSRIKEILGSDLVVINFDFTAHRIFSYYKHVVYYCNDEFRGNSKFRNYPVEAYKSSCEKKIIKNALFCIATSRYLYEKLSKLNSHTYEIPLGASFVTSEKTEHKQKNPNVVNLCLLGVINDRQISVKLINDLLQEPTFNIMLIGSVEDAFFQKLKPKERISAKGILKGKELMDELSKIDVGLALYNTSRINPGATPNKLWQYLAAGIPTVISEMPNLFPEDFPEKSVYVYGKTGTLRTLIFNAHQENSEDLAGKRIAFAQNNTWDQRVEVFLERLHENLQLL